MSLYSLPHYDDWKLASPYDYPIYDENEDDDSEDEEDEEIDEADPEDDDA